MHVWFHLELWCTLHDTVSIMRMLKLKLLRSTFKGLLLQLGAPNHHLVVEFGDHVH
jgi:hypothetical protein